MAAQVSILRAAISLHGHEQKNHTLVAIQVPSLRAAISPDGQKVNTQVDSSNASPDSNAINANCTNPHAQMVSLPITPPHGQQNLVKKLDQNHRSHHRNSPAMSDSARICV